MIMPSSRLNTLAAGGERHRFSSVSVVLVMLGKAQLRWR